MSDGTLFGFIHGLKDRREARKVRDAMRTNNFLDNPEEAIRAVADINPERAVPLRDYTENRNQQVLERQRGNEKFDNEKYRTAVTGMARGLRQVRDSSPQDLAGAFDSLTPTMKNGFGMADEEILQLREAITADPSLLDRLEGALNVGGRGDKPQILSAGAALVDATGNELYKNPGKNVVVNVPNARGGKDVYVVNAETGEVVQGGREGGSAPAMQGGGGGGAFNEAFGSPDAPRGIRNNNPGNIKDGPWARKQPGYVGGDGTFARFESAEAGQGAMERLLGDHYVNGQRSVTDAVNKYLGGPNNLENSQESRQNYINYVAGRLGIDPSAPIPVGAVSQLAQAMREFENGEAAPRGSAPLISSAGPPKESDGWRLMTEAEKAQAGIDPARAYQIKESGNNTGQIRQVPGQPTPGKTKINADITPQGLQSSLRALQRTRDQARRVRNHPGFAQGTGPIAGRAPSIRRDTVEFDKELEALVGNVVVDALITMKKASPNGATGFGAMNQTEGNWLKNSQGAYNAAAPDALKRNTLELERDAQVSIGMLYGIPPEATKLLLDRPSLAKAFDEKYGKGRAKEILGGN
jgi:hypothetical protein